MILIVKRFFTNLILFLLVVITILPVVYFILRVSGYSVMLLALLPTLSLGNLPQTEVFLDSTMGGLFSTMVGLITGIPSGLLINRISQQALDKAQQQAQEQLSRVRTNRTLKLVRDELDSNRSKLVFSIKGNPLDLRIMEQADRPEHYNLTGLSDIFWSALLSGNEVQWIKDLDLLYQISNAYYGVRTIINAENQYYLPHVYNAGAYRDVSSHAGEMLVKDMIQLRPLVLEEVKQTIAAIDRVIGQDLK